MPLSLLWANPAARVSWYARRGAPCPTRPWPHCPRRASTPSHVGEAFTSDDIGNEGSNGLRSALRKGRPQSCWHPLSQPLLWQGTEKEGFFNQATPYPLSPPWKIMLLSDGSVTRHLQLMTDMAVEVECLEMRNIGHSREGLPEETALIEGPLVQRQVFLHIPGPRGRAYVYASSWWNAEEVDSYLRDRSQPIWVSLSQGRAELYREILQVEYGTSPYLEERFQSPGPFWGRYYLFWHNGRPLTLIYEVFSTALEDLLGPMRLQSSSGSSSSSSNSSVGEGLSTSGNGGNTSGAAGSMNRSSSSSSSSSSI